MRKILIAILLAGIELGAIWGRSLAQQQTPEDEAERRQRFRLGAKLWPVYCNQCHNARTPAEKAPYEWDMVIMHMRSLGNIPPEYEKALLEYLKAR
jgi:mono/diheme cytochrome c family protein